MAYFLCLNEEQRLKEFIHGAKATWEDYEGLGIFDKHRLAHKEVAEIERNVQVWIWPLLKRKFNVTAYGYIASLLRTFIACFHDTRATTGNDTKTSFCQQTRRLHRRDIGRLFG